MRFMTIVKTRENCERPSPALVAAIMKLGAEASKKGAMVEMGGLLPTAAGAQVRLANGKITVTDGPFSEAKALEWTRKFLEAHIGLWNQELEVEVRQMMDAPEQGC